MPWIAGCTRAGMYLQGERHKLAFQSQFSSFLWHPKMTSRAGKPTTSIKVGLLSGELLLHTSFTLNAVGEKGRQGLLPNRCHVGTRAVALGEWLRCGGDGTSRTRMLPCQEGDCSVACSLRQDRGKSMSLPRGRGMKIEVSEGWAEMGEDSSSSNRRMHGVGRKEPWS
jgi:hypothetical protein